MSMVDEFKAFIARGNVIDLAVGVMIGGAFGAIVNSLVNDIITPIVSLVAGSVDFSNYFIPLSSKVTATTLAAAKEQGSVIAYGSFLTIVINFLILAWIIFVMVKGISKLRREEPAAPPEPAAAPADIQLLTEIRDLLKTRS